MFSGPGHTPLNPLTPQAGIAPCTNEFEMVWGRHTGLPLLYTVDYIVLTYNHSWTCLFKVCVHQPIRTRGKDKDRLIPLLLPWPDELHINQIGLSPGVCAELFKVGAPPGVRQGGVANI